MKRLSTQTFIEKSEAIHGPKYDYSMVEYVKSNIKVKIKCPKQHIFEQLPKDHLRGAGCQECAGHQPKYTVEQFIEVCKVVHDEKYNYSGLTFKNLNEKIKLKCPEHGDFLVIAKKHKAGQGCQECSKVKYHLKSPEQVIRDFNAVHKNAYTYENMKYKGSKKYIEVTCPIHRGFLIKANQHLSGSGCPNCVVKTYTNKQVIQKFIDVHGLTYDYSLVEYSKSYIPVKILCITHGEFEQAPDSHWSGSGCPKCARERTTIALRKRSALQLVPLDVLIEEFKIIHEDQYIYDFIDRSEYKNQESKIKIKCKKHGFFYRNARSHKKGRGCPDCITKGKSQEQAVKDFRSVHGDLYGYENTVYRGHYTKIEITCKEHGPFFQTPASHLKGAGCKSCNSFYTQDDVIRDFKAVHGETYGYDRLRYKKVDEKVEIYCKHHKEYFWQSVILHKKGSGCPQCGREKRVLSSKEILRRFAEIHGERYDYTDTVFKRVRDKITIRCRKHGLFEQVCSDHLSGSGCKKCGVDSITEKAIQRMRKPKLDVQVCEVEVDCVKKTH